MEFKTTASDPSGNVEVIQSKENDVFFGYLDFLKDKRKKRALSMQCCAIRLPQMLKREKPAKDSAP